jgi:hypothetical protein
MQQRLFWFRQVRNLFAFAYTHTNPPFKAYERRLGCFYVAFEHPTFCRRCSTSLMYSRYVNRRQASAIVDIRVLSGPDAHKN